jgi:hypothetical protein
MTRPLSASWRSPATAADRLAEALALLAIREGVGANVEPEAFRAAEEATRLNAPVATPDRLPPVEERNRHKIKIAQASRRHKAAARAAARSLGFYIGETGA